MQENQEFKIPTEIVELPSKGLLYPENNPLSSGQVEIKYMTAYHEDILTNTNYIQKGIVLDKLMKELIASPINYDDLIVGDKNAIMMAARILAYGKDYSFEYNGEQYTVDLSLLENKPFDETLITKGVNEFTYKLPNTDNTITFKILTGHDEKLIQEELESQRKLYKENTREFSTRLKYIITSINGNRDKKTIRDFVDKALFSKDSRALRIHIKNVQPDIDQTFFPHGKDEPTLIPIGLGFFWPEI
jgi:hypothetical protein